MKKIIASFGIFFLLLVGCSSKPSGIIYLGTPLNTDEITLESLFKEDLNQDVNMDFAQKRMTSSLLFRTIEQDAMDMESKKHILSAIKSCESLIINIGVYDIINAVKINQNEVLFEQEIIDDQMELMGYYVYRALDQIREVNETCKIAFILPYNPLKLEGEAQRTFTALINDSSKMLQSYRDEFNLTYVSLDKINSYLLSSHRLSNDGVKYCYENIKEALNG